MANEKQYDENLTLDEIVFQNRNKAYGAYNLRTTYPKVLTKAFVFGTLFFVVAASTPFIMMKLKELTAKEKVKVSAKMIEIEEEDPILEQPKEEEPPPPPPPPPQEEPPKIEIIQNVVPEPVKAPKVETPPPPISVQLTTQTGAVSQEGVKTPTYTPPTPPPGTGTAPKTLETKPQVSTSEVYTSVDQAAEYPGGLNAVRIFLQDNFDSSAVEGEGKLSAKLRFVVERDGSVSDVRVIEKSGNADFDAEAIRVVKKLKKWKPGKVKGENVRSYYTVPFNMMFE